MAPPGTVYILLNESMPGLVKIGRTTRTSEERARSLRTTGVPREFIVLWDEYVTDATTVERLAHQKLQTDRVDSKREFFRTAPKDAIAALMNAAAPYRVAAPSAGQVVEVLDELRQTYGDIFQRHLVSVAIVMTPDAVKLRTTETRAASGETTIIEMDLGFIWGGEEPWFSVEESARYNADRLIALGEFSLIMTTNLVREEEARRIDREKNPIYQRADRNQAEEHT